MGQVMTPDYTVDDRADIGPDSNLASGMLRVQIVRNGQTVETVWLAGGDNGFQWKQTSIEVQAGDVVRYDIRPSLSREFSNYEGPAPTVETLGDEGRVASGDWVVRVAIS